MYTISTYNSPYILPPLLISLSLFLFSSLSIQATQPKKKYAFVYFTRENYDYTAYKTKLSCQTCLKKNQHHKIDCLVCTLYKKNNKAIVNISQLSANTTGKQLAEYIINKLNLTYLLNQVGRSSEDISLRVKHTNIDFTGNLLSPNSHYAKVNINILPWQEQKIHTLSYKYLHVEVRLNYQKITVKNPIQLTQNGNITNVHSTFALIQQKKLSQEEPNQEQPSQEKPTYSSPSLQKKTTISAILVLNILGIGYILANTKKRKATNLRKKNYSSTNKAKQP